MDEMDETGQKIDQVLAAIGRLERAVGRLEGELAGFRNLAGRVLILEQWQNWMKGAWFILAAGFALLLRRING
jgi:hypothetical protein